MAAPRKPRTMPPPELPADDTPKTIESRALLGERGELCIHHEGRLYRLRRTRAGKLILTA